MLAEPRPAFGYTPHWMHSQNNVALSPAIHVCAGCCPLTAAQYPSNRESRTDHRFNLAALAGPLPISPVSSALPLVNRVVTLLFTEPDGLIVPFACT